MSVPSSARPPPVAMRSAREKAQDELVMQTNSSSIVSKRSVERIYYPDEPHYFRYFVKKFQRRAPLINRGYYLRLHAIDLAVRRFLERPGDKTKVVVNLGCGSDVLPWQCMTRYPDACRRTKFIDIDFPDLMSKKRAIVLNTPELSSVFEPLEKDASEHVILKSDMYSQIGCDLRNTADIDKAFSTFLSPSECVFMFVAEVSITYMETPGADGVIKWASSLSQAEFCLLEQILPDGPDHPFAKTMLSHFDKLKTPIKSVSKYPDLEAQNRRFSRLGWSYVKAISLWDVWTNGKWITAEQRRELDLVEPFDEWEEFTLFASHYCVVTARTFTLETKSGDDDVTVTNPPPQQILPGLLFDAYSGSHGKRRFGAAVRVQDELGEQVFANTFGLGTNTRLKSCDLYSFDSLAPAAKIGTVGPGSRVCHTIVDLGRFGSLLVGGRASPTMALRDCWHFSMERNKWSPTYDLPIPLYRHRMTQLGRSNMALLIGGKSDASTVSTSCFVYKPGFGWIECTIFGSGYQPVFSPVFISFRKHRFVNNNSGTPAICFEGILAGGLLEDGIIARQLLRWSLKLSDNNDRPSISFEPMTCSTDIGLLASRFGASTLLLRDGRIVVAGGVQHNGIVPQADELLVLNVSDSRLEDLSSYNLTGLDNPPSIPRPLLVGASIALAKDDRLIVLGGGATCFSMGTYWNEGCYTLDLSSLLDSSAPTMYLGPLRFQKIVEVTDPPQSTNNALQSEAASHRATISDIPRVRVHSEDDFETILKAGKPVVIEGSDLGLCIRTWTAAYLTEKVGPQRSVTVHEASTPMMDFNFKNFSYTAKDFGCFMKEVESGGKQYFRALSDKDPQDQRASIEADFPGLANDFQLPPEFSFVKRNEFSSVLRISGRVNMWLHYDVMANVYCQITGSKKLRLFPPGDVNNLSFAPGASSSSVDVFSGLETPSLALTHPYDATLGPGDILFLPPLWLHATAPLTDSGVAVNVFFRSLEAGYSSGRDVYGNRDIAAYERGRRDVARIADSFGKVPRDVREFYLRRLADELTQSIIE